MAIRADMEAFIDWDNDGGLDVGSFEFGTDGWTCNDSGVTYEQSTTQVHCGTYSLRVTWDGSAGAEMQKTFDTVIGRAYTFVVWVYVPSGDVQCVADVVGVASQSSVSTANTWSKLTFAFTATAITHTLVVRGTTTPAAGDIVYIDQAMCLGPGEDVTARLLGVRSNIEVEYGRDFARNLADVRPGDCSFELNNFSRDYTPDNGSSPLAGYLEPGKPVLIRGTYNGKAYDLFRGFLEDFELLPGISQRSVKMTAVDILTRLSDAKISTELYPSLQTGQALHKVLDAVGWPADKRDIDAGATTCRWWWEEGTGAWEACQKLMRAEGSPAFCSVGPSGVFVFKDRHHRLIDASSLTSQQTFRDGGVEPLFSDFVYDIGWKDIINHFEVEVQEREPLHQDEEGYIKRIFGTSDRYVLTAGETRTITVRSDEPFYAALDPVDRADLDDDNPRIWDYETISGDVTVTLSRTSGQSCDIIMHANSASVIQNMGLRATTVPVARTYVVKVEDPVSVGKHGVKSYEHDVPFAGRWDAEAIGNVIVGMRATRLPIVTITLKNGNATRMTAQLVRDISERITIIEAESGVSGEFYIEKISHKIAQAGHDHQTEFGCERVVTPPTTVFTFGVAGKGFNDGTFGGSTSQSSTKIFILDQDQLDQEYLGF